MKYSFVFWGIMLIVLTNSCKKHTIPDEEDFKNHPILWEQDVSMFSESKMREKFPILFDEQANVFLLIDNISRDVSVSFPSFLEMMIFSFDKQGNKRWEKSLVDSGYFHNRNSNIRYLQNRIIVSVSKRRIRLGQDDEFFDLLILDATSGEVISSYSSSNFIWDIAVKDNRIYFSEGDSLHCFDLNGNELWNYEGSKWFSLNVDGNFIYGLCSDGIVQFLDAGDECVQQWEWNEGSVSRLLKINENGDILVSSNQDLYLISKEGSTLEHHTGFTVQSSFDYNFKGITKDNGFLFANNEDRLRKYDNAGEKIWETETYMSKVRPYFSEYYPDIAENGNIYCPSSFGIYVYDSDGKLDWHIGLYQDIVNLVGLRLDNEGNIFCLSTSGKFRCIKGDGSPPLD